MFFIFIQICAGMYFILYKQNKTKKDMEEKNAEEEE